MEHLANIGEFVGGIAVIISLLFVGFQLRASVRQSRIDAYSKIAELFTQLTTSVFQNESTSKLFWHGAADYESLSPDERNRFHLMMAMYTGIVDTVMMQEIEGVYPSKAAYERHMVMLDEFFSQPGVQSWWRERGAGIAAPNVADRVDRQRAATNVELSGS